LSTDVSKILIGRVADIHWIRVEGKGSFQNSAGLKSYANKQIAAGATKFVFDLENCGGMDSTFIGTLTGIVIQLDSEDDKLVGLANTNSRILQLICSLGLDAIFEIDESGHRWEEERKLVAQGLSENKDLSTKDEKAKVSLAAHEALGDANPDNVPRFEDVVEFLRKDLD